MPNIMIRDLEMSKEIDRKAMANIMGGASSHWSMKKKLGETYQGTYVGASGWLYNSYKVHYQEITFDDYEEIVNRKA